MEDCIFCNIGQDKEQKVVLENDHCMYLQKPQEVLIGSGVIIPKQHRETVFDLTKDEWDATYDLLKKVKELIDSTFEPNGYNIGWNVGKVGGQEIFHAHLHVIPRYDDEKFSGKGIRHWIKKAENKRSGKIRGDRIK